jgi:LETM1-like protein
MLSVRRIAISKGIHRRRFPSWSDSNSTLSSFSTLYGGEVVDRKVSSDVDVIQSTTRKPAGRLWLTEGASFRVKSYSSVNGAPLLHQRGQFGNSLNVSARPFGNYGGNHFDSRQIAFFSTEPVLKTKDDDSMEPRTANAPHVVHLSRPAQSTIPSRTLGTTPVPTPLSAPQAETNPLQSLKNSTPKTVIRKGLDLMTSAFKAIVSFLIKLPVNMFFYATHPTETKATLIRMRDVVKAEAHHYWVGTKLLWADIITARKLLNKTLEGTSLTRRERKQLLRTVSDLFRLIPFSMFVIVPFMEFALPFALRLFPNMLPSTYQDSLKNEENMKRELKSRIAMAQFFQE